ncbi:hypothetical protein LAZ67_20002729 [Cordylochernes scorpioides]|uniref:Integrase catalytic domain-containing protein n=1 Tax=Cordylochernes scorpioides TaxID=51811 RepID=A0ABY6LL02_9ARAC|nr:hypothetical protein LAZ67_20002729 [Cordylochernes scorpioides]
MDDQPVSSAELKKLRTPVRARFTKAFNELETEIKKKEVKKADVEKILRRLQTHHEKLSILNMRMEEALLRESASEDIFTAEYESVCEYEDNFSNIMTDYEALAEKDDASTISGTAAMNYQLPKLEFKKFGGEPREWITFWSQFSTIDRDPQMPPETKFQYLFQATAENSEYIKSRFGEDEMLVEIYVRDLLQNVLQNVRAEGKMSVVKLYDRLETQLRALETLGVARDKFAAMLYPLVESALPEDTLRVWERSQYTVSGRGAQDKLTQLMTFLKTEVKGESRVNMAKTAFKIDNNQDAKDDRSNRKSLSKKNTGSKMPTATDLTNTTQIANTTQMRNNCIFCGNGHPSQECYSGQRMHLPEKKDKAKGKNVCFWCLLPGHGFKKCRIKPRCPVCGGKHYPIMCPTLEAQKTSHLQKAELKVSGESPATKQETANQFTSTTLNNATVGGVYLQTLIVKISGPKGKHNVRVLLDCGSQRSYISKRMVDALGLKRVQQVTLTHNLFGGGEIRQKKHNVYKVNVSSLNNEYMDDLKFLDQEVICGHISQVQDHTILNELKARGINLTDICQGEEISIHMLIGSDLLSSILTSRMQILQNGVVATETKLGWTVMGPAIGKDMENSCLIGNTNPADLPSRGESPSKFTKSGWWEGPKWLQEKKEDWPVSKVQYDLEAIEEERRKTVVAGFVAKKPEENPWYLNLYKGKREVTLTQILRVIAWMLRFKPSEYKGDIISQEELDSAEKSLVKIIQSESIGEEDPKMKQLHAFQDKEGLWRVKTRIVNRNDDELFRLPNLIPTNHPVTELIVKSVHEKMYHCGAQTLRSVLREKFWIPKARQLVRHVIHKCPRCRRFETKRVDVPEASLPQHRVRDVVVFEVTGIDLGGPLYLEDGQKVWFVIFTCGVYRAVHLELVTSLSTEALVGAVERFVARRGCPAVIYSDNGTNLVGLRNELYRVNFGVKWKLNPPAAPWWGGWIERIVGLTKKLLRRLLGKRVVNYEEMVTILENCERVINARPLTYIAEDNDDLVPLTQEMFLREPRTEGEIDLNEFRCNFGKSYEKHKRLLKNFRKRFRSEYLGLLVHHDNRKKQRQLKVGDIVLVEVENRKQINWPMGKITKVFPGTDNVRRLVEVKTKSGFMKRAVQRLFPLEVPSEEVEQGDGELKPAEDEIVREKTSGVESASVQEKTTPVKTTVMLTTARIKIKDNNGVPQTCRALIDSGSQANFISGQCRKRLGLEYDTLHSQISGISGHFASHSYGLVEFEFTPHFKSDELFKVNALVLDKLTNNLPTLTCPKSNLAHLKTMPLADPDYNISAPIDILIGAELAMSLFTGESVIGDEEQLTATSSKLGWLLSGRVSSKGSRRSIRNIIQSHHAYLETQNIVEKFWKLESIPDVTSISKDENESEIHFVETHGRDSTGRYVVQLPFRNDCHLGDSRSNAIKRLCSLERSLIPRPEVYDQYRSFIKEYLELGHMSLVPKEDIIKGRYYLPHHPVIKEKSCTTKLRVVFDASAKTDSGLSLNDALIPGPKIQQDLFHIILRFRIHPVAINADIAKIYRQIRISQEDSEFQRIVCRNVPHDKIKDYRLETVTYGTSCAPFLATRIIKQLALDEQSKFPKASKIALTDFYVDDLVTGTFSVDEGKNSVQELYGLLSAGGFELRKWTSNVPDVLSLLPNHLRSTNTNIGPEESKEFVNVLGLQWQPRTDGFTFKGIALPLNSMTKRGILSQVAKIFDPLGWISPFTTTIKLILQELWKTGLEWDDPIPEELRRKLTLINQDLPSLEHIQIPRCVVPGNFMKVEFHGFCDASQKAYAASLYLKVILSNTSAKTFLLVAKTRVAPMKVVSLPKLNYVLLYFWQD